MATNSYISYYNIRALADKDAVLNTYFTDIIGNKEDTASNASNTASIVALLRYIIANLSSDTDIETLIGKLDTLAHTGAVDNFTTLMGYIKQLITDEIALSTIIGIPTGADLSSDISAIKTVVDNIYSVTDTEIAAIKTIVDAVDNIEDLIDGTTATPTAYRREAGKTQIFTKQITNAANAGDVTIATVTDSACIIKSISLSSNGATTVDLTTAAIYGGTAKVLTFIDTWNATQAALDAPDKQVVYQDVLRLPATSTIVIDLVGTGATPVDLQVTIEYISVEDGGYLI